jgi:hypothetical protein
MTLKSFLTALQKDTFAIYKKVWTVVVAILKLIYSLTLAPVVKGFDRVVFQYTTSMKMAQQRAVAAVSSSTSSSSSKTKSSGSSNASTKKTAKSSPPVTLSEEEMEEKAKAEREMKREKIFEKILNTTVSTSKSGEVVCYEDCDYVREKSLQFIATHQITKARYMSLIGITNIKAFNAFFGGKGETSGANSKTFGRAYLFLEKVRILNSEGKSSKRKQAEKETPQGYFAFNPLKEE